MHDGFEFIENVNEVKDTSKAKKSTPGYAELAKLYLFHEQEAMVYHQGETLVYDGTRYRAEHELTPKIRRFLIRHDYKCDNQTVSNVVGSILAMSLRDSVTYPALPFYIGPETFPSKVIAYRNGLLDVEAYLAGDVRLLDHTPLWVSTVCLPYDFIPKAECPQWLAFLDEIFGGDTERIKLLQEWFGYCLFPDVSQHKLLLKIGPPRAGKGTTDRVLEAMLGAENVTAYNLHSLADKFGLRRLMGKLVAFVGEVNLANSRDKYRILETLNSIVGADPVSIETKGEKHCPTIKLPTRFSVSCNEMPIFVDPSGALADRLLALRYDRSFVGKEDRSLVEKLLTELPGISLWSLDGYRRLQSQCKFTEPVSSKDKVLKFRRDSSHVFAFMQDCLVIESRLNPGNLIGVQTTSDPLSIALDDLERRYLVWCSETRTDANTNYLTHNLNTLLPTLEIERKMVKGIRQRWFQGVGLRRD